MVMEKKRIIGLDVVRFLASLGIIAYHYFFIGPIQGFYSNDVFQPIAFWGEFGVDIFFILSGFVILFSAETKKNSLDFFKGRLIRIYPAFIVCSVVTMLTGMIMPGTYKSDLLFRWINSLTLCNDLWGVQPLSSIYWTLMVEMKFYILTAVVMKLGIWKKHKYHILFAWVCLAIINMFGLQWSWLEIILNTKYAGHFAIGIILYLLYKGQRNTWMPAILGGGIWLVYRNCINYTNWIRGIYDDVRYSDVDILLAVIMLITILYLVSNVTTLNSELNKLASFFGAWSYTIYLMHADFGYFIRTQYNNRVIVWMPWLSNVVNEHIIMAIAIFLSLLLSWVILKLVNWMTENLFINKR